MMANPARSQPAVTNEWACPAGHVWKAPQERACPQCGAAPVDAFATIIGPRGRRPRSLPSVSLFPEIPGYEVLQELGRGGMGVVYLARQSGLNRPVALKTLLPGAREPARFKTEARAVARLQHPNIVQVFDVGEWRPHPQAAPVAYYSMEYCPGGNLDAALNGNPLQPRDAAALCQKLARAVQHAHEHGVIHRDLKPANVLLAGEPHAQGDVTHGAATGGPGAAEKTHVSPEAAEPKVADFGLARNVDDDSGHTRTGDVMGTPAYMAPEQATGQRVGPPADIWALGAILYECLTGRPPFKAATAAETMLLVLSQDPVAPSRLNPRVPADLETICLKCLNKDAARRYATAGEVADDLGRFLDGQPIKARPLGPLGRLRRWVWRYPLPASLIILLAGAAAFALMLAVSLASSRDAFRRTLDRLEAHAESLRGDVRHWDGKVNDAEAGFATAKQGREAIEAQLKAVSAELERERAKTGDKSAVRVRALHLREKGLLWELGEAKHHEEKKRFNREKMRGNRDDRVRRLKELEDILNPKEGPPMPPPRPRKKEHGPA